MNDIQAFFQQMQAQAFKGAASCREAVDMTREQLADLYAKAYQLYETSDYLPAKELFQQLLLLDSFVPDFWAGFAGCCFYLKEYDQALQAYAVWALQEEENPAPHFYAAYCYLQKKEDAEAQKACREAEMLARKHATHYPGWLTRVRQLQGEFYHAAHPI